MPKSKVQSILPLLKNQEILLFNHLLSHKDDGQIIVQAEIDGVVDVDLFNQSLQELAKHHEVFRMSIQWENISQKIQVVQSEVEVPFTFHDWSKEKNTTNQLQNFITEIEDGKMKLSKAPVSEFYLIQLAENQFKLIWKCHHVLFDGISSRIALKKLAEIYADSNKQKSKSTLANWKKVTTLINDKQYLRSAKEFWQSRLATFDAPTLISRQLKNESQNVAIREIKIPMPQIDELLKEHGITLNSLLQSVISILLSKLQNSSDVAIGTVVSGRNLKGVDVNEFIGMLANIVPLVSQIEENKNFIDFTDKLQLDYAQAREYENYSLQQLFEDQKWKGNRNLFDCLLVVENFDNSKIESSTFQIDEMKSSITSNYPLTITALPDSGLTFNIRTNHLVSKEIVDWLMINLKKIFESIHSNSNQSIQEIMNSLSDSNGLMNDEEESIDFLRLTTDASTAKTSVELKLAQIWEEVLQINPIGIHDHFFDIGGKSIQAVRMFTLIYEQFGKQLNPSVLLTHPTISELVELLEDESESQWKSLVPLKTRGNLDPIFCIHAGGAHVFIYNEFANSVDKERPIYALQPIGLDGTTKPHQSIKEMAASYLEEIMEIQTDGPIHIVGHCFSGAVALEMAHQLIDLNRLGEIIIVDSAVFSYYLKEYDYQPEIGLRWRFVKKILKGQFSEVSRIVKVRALEFKDRKLSKAPVRNLEKLVIHLNDIYLDYKWNPIDSPIHLITSSEFAAREDKMHHIRGWTAMSNHQLTNQIVTGEHQQIFKQPSVVKLAESVERILNPNIQLSFVEDQVDSEIQSK